VSEPTLQEIMSSIDKLKLVSRRTAICLNEIIEPLNERLAYINLVIRWSEDAYVISRVHDTGLRVSAEITLGDELYSELLDMSDNELLEHCKNWGWS
jgi:hypothetical protein